MDSCSPPKVKRVVHISPVGVVGSSLHAVDSLRSLVSRQMIKPIESEQVKPHPVTIQDFSIRKHLSYLNDQKEDKELEPCSSGSSTQLACYQGVNQKSNNATPVLRAICDDAMPMPQAMKSNIMTLPKEYSDSCQTETETFRENAVTLPQAFNEVIALQKGQFDTIKREENLLQQLKRDKKLAKEKNEDLNQEIASLIRRKYLSQEEAKMRNSRCKQYHTDIQKLIAEVEELRHNVQQKSQEISHQKRCYDKYKEKMNRYAQEVEDFEDTTEIFKQLKSVKSDIDVLQTKRDEMIKEKDITDSIINGVAEAELNSQIRDVKEKITKQELLNIEIEKLMETEIEKHKSIEQATHVLRKRNAAQLTRLKRQVKEVQVRSRRWKDQMIQLEQNIADCKQTLEE